MTTYYLSSVDGDNGSDGLSWANAYATFEYAVETVSAVAGGPHTILVDDAHSESLAADTTVTVAGDVRILCVDRDTGALAASAVVGAQATNYTVALVGAFKCYIYGVQIKVGTGSTAKYIQIAITGDGCNYEFENCNFNLSGSGNCLLMMGHGSGGNVSFIKTVNCTITFSAIGQRWRQQSATLHEHINLTLAGTAPTTLLVTDGGTPGADVVFRGCDLSLITGTLTGAPSTNGSWRIFLENCKLGLNVTMMASPSGILNKSTGEVWAFNCSLDNDDASYDEHFHLYHGDAFGETYVTEDVYCNTGAAYDGTNRVSWQIITRASNCSYYTPYTSPWIDVYHSGTSAITPYLEILRSGSTTKYQDDEVWSEWSYQGTSGSTKATIVNDRMTPLGTAADQTASSLGASDWTGEDATNNAYMKLESGSITPAEIGHIRARAVVGEPNITVYVDPYIRGLT